MENVEHEVIIKETERAHWAKEHRPSINLPVIATFTNSNFSEEVKISFIKAANDGNNSSPIFVS